MKSILFIVGVLWLFAAEILRVYFIMPFPGSQQINSIDIAYFINTHIVLLRLIGYALISYPILEYNRGKAWFPKLIVVLVGIAYIAVFYLFNYRFQADKMFYKAQHRWFANATNDTTNKKSLVIGVVISGIAKAYPLQIIGYHHQIADSIGGEPILVTYCTVCRTGRVYSPEVNGKKETFRLVGMDHFNAMFEDATTKSWWRQATGEAIAGPLKGQQLKELPCNQLTLAAWLMEYPNSLILQPDEKFKKQYAELKNYDKGTVKSKLEKRDTASWKPKSWVVGIIQYNKAKAYDWNTLTQQQVLNDEIDNEPIAIVLESDTVSFHAFHTDFGNNVLNFQKYANNLLIDTTTHTIWNMAGECVEGPSKGARLQPVQCYQEFWHSWKTFHPNTLVYR